MCKIQLRDLGTFIPELSLYFALLYFTIGSSACRSVGNAWLFADVLELACSRLDFSPYLRSIDLRNVKSLLVCLNRKDITHDVT